MVLSDCGGRISIHAPRVGCDLNAPGPGISPHRFQSTHPVWGATRYILSVYSDIYLFQSTHPVWGATEAVDPSRRVVAISIHAPRVGCDLLRGGRLIPLPGISIHAPRVGCDPAAPPDIQGWYDFNPRTPCGVRRPRPRKFPGPAPFQSTHPVWGATLPVEALYHGQGISIHAPRVGCDTAAGRRSTSWWRFQSTHPVWGATASAVLTKYTLAISIHAPRVGCDRGHGARGADAGISIHAPRVGCDPWAPPQVAMPMQNFNPRTPCGVRPNGLPSWCKWERFQSTHPVWGATISWQHMRALALNFNPRTPCGVRQALQDCQEDDFAISIHAPRVGCDGPGDLWGGGDLWISIHAPRVGCDFSTPVPRFFQCQFQSTHPVWGATLFPPRCRQPICDFNPRTPCGVRLRRVVDCAVFGDFNPRTPCGVRQSCLCFLPGR